MPLQNRVDPFGAVQAVAAPGLYMGNRGSIHDPERRTLLKRRWSTKAWIICQCRFKGRRREVMGRNGSSGGAGWTELFFLDEVTALAAGHRPCFHCRRKEAQAFARAFAAERDRHPMMPAPAMDAVLHRERRASGGPVVNLPPKSPDTLPDGTMVEVEGRVYALREGALLAWSFYGYGSPDPVPDVEAGVALITPPSTVDALRRGYRPAWHPSACS